MGVEIGHDLESAIATTPVVGEGGIFVPTIAAVVVSAVVTPRIILFAGNEDSQDAGTWVVARNSRQNLQTYIVNSGTHADEDAVTYKAYMDAGTYTCIIEGYKNTVCGIMKVKIDGTTVATFDEYAVAEAWNQVDTTTNISVATSGLKDIQVIVDGTSNTDYYLIYTFICFFRTA